MKSLKNCTTMVDFWLNVKSRLFCILSTRIHDFMDRSLFCCCLSTKCRVFVDRSCTKLAGHICHLRCLANPFWFPLSSGNMPVFPDESAPIVRFVRKIRHFPGQKTVLLLSHDVNGLPVSLTSYANLLWMCSFRLLSSMKCRFYWRRMNQQTFQTYFFCWPKQTVTKRLVPAL